MSSMSARCAKSLVLSARSALPLNASLTFFDLSQSTSSCPALSSLSATFAAGPSSPMSPTVFNPRESRRPA